MGVALGGISFRAGKSGGQVSGMIQMKVPRPKNTGCCFTGLSRVKEAYPKEIYLELLSHGRKRER